MHYQHASFSTKPEPVTFATYRDITEVRIVLNIIEVEDPVLSSSETEEVEAQTEETTTTIHWEGDLYSFWEANEHLDKEAIIADPEAYSSYVPVKYKVSLKDKAQEHLDYIRDHKHIVAVPTYKEGWAVMHRVRDDINLIAGMLVPGGLPYYEFADGQVVAPLLPEDIQKIYTDLAAHEIKLQQDKQACWAAIDAAKTQEEADAALKAYLEQ